MPTLESYIGENESRFLEKVKEFVRIPSVSALPRHKEDVARAADFLAEHMRSLGLSGVAVMPTGGHPAVYGEWLGAPGRPTALVYGHYDVQPVEPLDQWVLPPFDPQVKDGQLWARGAADDKAEILMHLQAIEAHLKVNGRLPVNVKCLFEGEEEIGSEHLDQFLVANRELLRSDVAVISDNPWFDRGVPSICYGLRGITYLQVNVKSADSDLHSGLFGGAIANPIQALAEIIAGLKDSRGRITVPHFYDRVRPLDPEERREFASLPFDEARYREELGVPALFGEEGFTTIERVWARPTLELNGIWGGFTGEGAKTVLPARASAKISCRLVPNQDPEEITDLVEARLRELCPPTVTMEVVRIHSGKGALIPLDHPAIQAASRAMERAFQKQPVFIRAGGSLPLVAALQERLGISSVLMGMGQPDEHVHAPNEHQDLANLYRGIRAAAFMWEELAATAQGA